MARISTYPVDSVINPTDRVIGSDGGNNNATKNYLVSEFGAYVNNNPPFSVAGFDFTFNMLTVNAVATVAGGLSVNNSSYASVTQIKVNKTDRFGFRVYPFILLALNPGDILSLRESDQTDTSAGGIYTVQSITDSTNEVVITVIDSSGTGTVDATSVVSVRVQRGADTGTETDPIFVASPSFNITSQQITNWDEAFSWGDHADEGYLTTETEPIFVASAAFNITSQQITNWDEAFSWGDHAVAGYVTVTTTQTISGEKSFSAETNFLNAIDAAGVVYVGGYLELDGSNSYISFTPTQNPGTSQQLGDHSLWVDSEDLFCFKQGGSGVGRLDFSLIDNAVPKTYQFPDESGTIALLSDLIPSNSYANVASFPSQSSGSLTGEQPAPLFIDRSTASIHYWAGFGFAKIGGSDYVATTGNQSVFGLKTFDTQLTINGSVVINEKTSGDGGAFSMEKSTTVNSISSTVGKSDNLGGFMFDDDDYLRIIFPKSNGGTAYNVLLANANLTANRSYEFPDQSGTLALAENTQGVDSDIDDTNFTLTTSVNTLFKTTPAKDKWEITTRTTNSTLFLNLRIFPNEIRSYTSGADYEFRAEVTIPNTDIDFIEQGFLTYPEFYAPLFNFASSVFDIKEAQVVIFIDVDLKLNIDVLYRATANATGSAIVSLLSNIALPIETS